jgi:gamma-glutamylcyclotransferase (GGCT)/AIG2-like uncharacterized protein YtfP
MARQLFVYGTLMAPEVLEILLKRVPRMTAATLYQHRLYSIKSASYPGILPKPNESVKGLVLWEMTPREFQLLDAYEGTPQDESLYEYRQKEVEVEIEHSSEKISAVCYVYVRTEDLLIPGWSYENWRTRHMNDYLSKITVPLLSD